MEIDTIKITEYLRTNGPMSGRDICDDCSVDEIDVDLACQSGAIKRCAPDQGGVDPWYRLNRIAR